MPTLKAPPTAKAAVPAAKKKPARSAAPVDAVALQTSDHRAASKLFKAYEKLVKADAGGDERLGVAWQISAMLPAYSTIEKEIFYPALHESPAANDLLDEAEVEHAGAKHLVSQIESMDPDDDFYDAKVTVLGEYVEHHVQKEEDKLFAKAGEAKLDPAQLGADLQARKQELTAEPEAEDA